MAEEITPECSACAAKLGDPQEEIDHPDADFTPDDPHFDVQERGDGELRAQCTETGQLASVIVGNRKLSPLTGDQTGTVDDVGEGSPPPQNNDETQVGSGGSQDTPPSPKQSDASGNNEVFDFKEDKDQMDILGDVVENPHYDLTEEQTMEVASWAEDYDGKMPPQVLEDLLKNMQGVQKQTAKLVKQRYELKLNNWMREQSENDTGPPIGMTRGRPMPQSGSSPPSRPKAPTPDPPEKSGNQKEEKEPLDEPDGPSGEVGGLPGEDLRETRRKRRVTRRNDAMDVAVEEAAKQAAPQIAAEFTSNFGRYFGIPAKIIEAKAEKDPDWFLEKLDDLGLGMEDFMEPSEAKKQETQDSGGGQSQTEVDKELEEALQDTQNIQDQQDNTQDQSHQQHSPQGSKTPKSPPQEERDEHHMRADPDQSKPPRNEEDFEMEESDHGFDDIFGSEEEQTEPQEAN